MSEPVRAWRSAAAAAFSLTIAMGIGRFAYTPILPAMQQHAGLDAATAGMLASINFTGYLLGALASTALARLPSRLSLYRASLILSIATTAAMGLTGNFFFWSALRFVSGIASAGILIIGVPMTMETLAKVGKSHLLGVVFGGVGCGIAISGLAVSWLDPLVGWRGDWLWLGLIAALLGLPAWAWQKGAAAEESSGAAGPGRLRLSLPVLILLVAYTLEGLGYVVNATFLVIVLKGTPGLGNVGLFAWVVVGLAGIPSTVLWGLATRRIGQAPALILASLLQALGTALPVLVPTPAAALIAAALFGSTFTGIVTLAFGLGREMAPDATGRMIGLLTIFYGIGQILGPFGAGLMIARGSSFAPPLLLAAAAVLLAALLIATVWAARHQTAHSGRRVPGG